MVDSSNEFGEDTWELFEMMKKSFGVTLDYASLLGSSVREISELIARQATTPLSEKCLTTTMFYLLRREFVSGLSVPKSSIRPNALLTSLLPWSKRRDRWLLLEKHLQLELPALRMPAWLFISILLLSVVAGFLFWETAWNNLLWVGILTISAWIALLRLVVPLGRAFPDGGVLSAASWGLLWRETTRNSRSLSAVHLLA